MSLYRNFTLREWLALHCATKDVDMLFRKALKDNDEPMAVLALAELIRRGDTDLAIYAIQEATDAGYFELGSHFSIVFANALMQCGNRDPLLKSIGKNVHKKGSWPKTATELLADDADCECPAARSIIQKPDNRLDKFLKGFMRNGWFSIEFGFFAPGIEWNPHFKKQTHINTGEHRNLVIKDGFILNKEEIPNILSMLDTAGITNALPAFAGNELDIYTLDNDNWVIAKDINEEDFFYVSYYSVE